MKCTPISDTHIQNNTCVLAPEVTEGPYYHNQDHLLRQNIAGLQDGLLLVCWSVLSVVITPELIVMSLLVAGHRCH